MPEISRFYGIVVFMNYREHEPPHFHARYQEQEVSIEIKTGMMEGKMSKRALRMLFEQKIGNSPMHDGHYIRLPRCHRNSYVFAC